MTAPRPFLFPAGAAMRRDNLVLHAEARRHRVKDFAGPLSVKTVLRGEVAWTLRGRDLTVDPGSFLVLGAGEPYSMNIDSRRPVETCCVFFQDGFAETIAQDATTALKSSLDDPGRQPRALGFLSCLHPAGGLRAEVQNLARRCEGELHPSGFEEEFLLLARNLLLLYERVRERMAQVPAAKESTREELFRRLEAARAYLHGHSDEPVSLTEAARAAFLSPYHFHRAFTSAFETTPHAYLTTLRLARAHALLTGGASALQACVESGFSSASSFTRLFRSRYGVPPSAIRKIRTASRGGGV